MVYNKSVCCFLVLVSLESLMNLVINAIAKLPIFPNLLKFPIYCVRFNPSSRAFPPSCKA